jgi:hypothetical protein
LASCASTWACPLRGNSSGPDVCTSGLTRADNRLQFPRAICSNGAPDIGAQRITVRFARARAQ